MSEELIPLKYSTYRVSNSFMSAKGKTTLYNTRLIDIAICKIQQMSHMAEDAELIANIYSAEIKELFGDTGNSYRTLRNAAKTLASRTILIEDGKGNFIVFPVVQKVEYNRGVLTIRMNEEVRKYILGLKSGNYTQYRIAVDAKATSVATLRMYQIFEQELYPGNRKYNEELGCVVVEYPVNELKFTLGLCDDQNPALDAVKKKMGKKIDWDMLYEALPKEEKIYPSTYNFIYNAIEPAQRELEEISNIRFEYQRVKTKGKAISKLRFFIYKNEENEKKLAKQAKFIEKILKIPDEVRMELYEEFVGLHKLKREDIDTFLIKASGDALKVREAIYYVNGKDNINDFTGYIISVLNNPEWDLSGGTAVVNDTDIAPERTRMAKEYIKTQTKKDTMSKNPSEIWNNIIKQRDDFSDFISYMESTDHWDLETFELVYKYEEMIDHWKKWKAGR